MPTNADLREKRFVRLRVAIEDNVLVLRDMIEDRARDKRSVTKYAIRTNLRKIEGALIAYGIIAGFFDDALIYEPRYPAASLGINWAKLVRDAEAS